MTGVQTVCSSDLKIVSYKSFSDKEYLKKTFIKNSINKIFYADLHDYELNRRLDQITKELKIKSIVYDTPSFLLGLDQVQDDFKGKTKFMMAQFYQKQRRRFNILINSNQKPIQLYKHILNTYKNKQTHMNN